MERCRGARAGSLTAKGTSVDMILEHIDSPADLRTLTPDELAQLSGEIRAFIVDAVTATGGHLGSNLGVVELTLALHRTFDSPRDLLLWDTGHQAYVHKLVTGRRDAFAHLRQEDGLSGLPEPDRVRARLGGEQPRVDRPELRPRHGDRPRAAGQRPPGGGRGGRRRAHRGHGLRGAQQPRPLRQAGGHRPQRQRPLVRPDRVAAVAEPHPSPPQPRLRPGPPAAAHACSANCPAWASSPTPASTASPAPCARSSPRTRSSRPSASATPARSTATTSPAWSRRWPTPPSGTGPIVVHVLTQKGRGYAPAEEDDVQRLHDVKVGADRRAARRSTGRARTAPVPLAAGPRPGRHAAERVAVAGGRRRSPPICRSPPTPTPSPGPC